MAILPTNVRQQVEEMFSSLDADVKMILVDEGGASELDDLLREIEELSPKLAYERRSAAEAAALGVAEESVPSILLDGPAGVSRARFAGAPAGHEFGVLVQDIIDLSRGDIDLSDATKSYLDGLEQDVHLQVFTTAT